LRRCRTIDEIINFILQRHKKIRDKGQEGGVHGTFMYNRGGKRVAFAEVNNFRIFDWDVLPNNCLSIQTIATGYTFRGNKQIQQTARTILSDLAVINVYDYAAEFFSENLVDFAYTMNTEDGYFHHLIEYSRSKTGELRATWVNESNDTERLLMSLASGPKIILADDPSRNVDMDFEL